MYEWLAERELREQRELRELKGLKGLGRWVGGWRKEEGRRLMRRLRLI